MPSMLAMTARMRWLIGGAGVVAAVAIVAVAVMVLGSRPTPDAMTYVPRDAAVVAELRPDFPGDQLSRVGNLLAHFPGYKDQSILGQKLDETLAKITTSASNGSVDYATQVKPWLAGPLYAGGGAGAMASRGAGDFVVVFTTDGTVTCEPFTGNSSQAETYRGLTIREAAAGAGGAPGGCAIEGRQVVIGSVAWVKAAIDAHADHQGIDGLPEYRSARDRLGGDRLATLFVSRTAMQAGGLPSGLGTLAPIGSAAADALRALPAWAMAGIRAEDGALVADLVTAPVSGTAAIPGVSLAPGASFLTPPPTHASTLAGLLPGDAAAVYEFHGAGIALQNALATLRSMPDLGSQLGQLDAILALAGWGSAQSLVGWVGDAGVVVVPDGASATGGVVLLAPDEAAARDRAGQIVAVLRAAGAFGGPKVTITETTIDGTTVTLADLGDLATLLGGAGVSAGAMPVPPGTHVVVSIASHGPAVLVGSSEGFVRRILETATGATLADQASYRNALALASTQNSGQLYLAAAQVRALAEGALPAPDKARYDNDIKPYLEPLDALLATVTPDQGGIRVRLVLTVK